MTVQRRDRTIQVRLSDRDAKAIARVAKAREVTVSEAIRQLVAEEDAGLTGGAGTIRGDAPSTTKREA